jgi:hypothetical protein
VVAHGTRTRRDMDILALMAASLAAEVAAEVVAPGAGLEPATS